MHGRLCGEIGLDVVVELTLRDGALVGERCVTLNVQLGFLELRLGLSELRPRAGERRLELP